MSAPSGADATIAEEGRDMTIHLKPDQEHRIAEAVRSGAYQSPDEVIDRRYILRRRRRATS
jgi:Arc/MetJ-type ribon-helix-helix transcriptional regulator